jgi:hypothetical protein
MVVVVVVQPGRSQESGGRVCVDAFSRNLASVVMMFSCLIYFIKDFYKFCTISAICEVMLQ